MSTEPTAPCSPHPTATKNNILTPTFIHAPGLGPDLKRVWFPLDGSVCWRVLGREAWKWLRWGWGSSALNERRCQGRVRWRICVDTPVAGNTMLGAVLAVFSWQMLLESHIVQISQLKKCKLWQHTCETGGWTDRVKKKCWFILSCGKQIHQGGELWGEKTNLNTEEFWISFKCFNVTPCWGKSQTETKSV